MPEIRVAPERSEANAASRERLDPIEPRKTIDVDEAARARDAALHQVEQVGAGGEIGGSGRRGSRDGLRNGRGPEIIEAVHATCLRSSSSSSLWASSTASVIPA